MLTWEQLIKESSGSDFTNFFLALPSGWKDQSLTAEDKEKMIFTREGVLELCWNHGTGEPSRLSPHIRVDAVVKWKLTGQRMTPSSSTTLAMRSLTADSATLPSLLTTSPLPSSVLMTWASSSRRGPRMGV